MITVWYCYGIGIQLFFNISCDYFNQFKVYPKVSTELPEFLNKLGYRVIPVHVCRSKKWPDDDLTGAKEPERLGLIMSKNTATVLMLKYG